MAGPLPHPKTGGLGRRPTPKGHVLEALGIMMERGEDFLGGAYTNDEASWMQLETEPAPGVFVAEVRPSLLDLDSNRAPRPRGPCCGFAADPRRGLRGVVVFGTSGRW